MTDQQPTAETADPPEPEPREPQPDVAPFAGDDDILSGHLGEHG